MWQKLAKVFSGFMERYGKSYLVSAVSKAVGVAGGFWGWLIALLIKLGWKKANKEIQSGARLADRTSSDKEVLEQYQEKIKNGVSEDELIESELDLLNPNRND